jgi:hypothetical protein
MAQKRPPATRRRMTTRKISNIPPVQPSEYPLTKPSFPPRSQRSRGTAESNESRTRESHFAATFTDLTYISLMLRGHIMLSDELVTHFLFSDSARPLTNFVEIETKIARELSQAPCADRCRRGVRVDLPCENQLNWSRSIACSISAASSPYRHCY